MCGICGFYGSKNRKVLEAMSRELAHRGPDMEGFYEDDSVSFAHRRLSIIDLSPEGKQPMANENNNIFSIVNGEIYNFKQIRSELLSAGHTFCSKSDSEVIVHAYEEYGEDFVHKLNGMFAIAIWDSLQKKLLLIRDRLGIKPLYYAQFNDSLVFASEIKAILKFTGINKEFNQDCLYQYLAFQCILTADTMFKGIYKLEPGNMLIFKDGKLTCKRYWFLDESGHHHSDTQGVESALKAAVESHLVSDVPVGVLLSGGLDSSSIVAIMHEAGLNNIETFTAGFNQPDDEFIYSRQVADRFKTNHHELLIEPKRIEVMLEKIVWHMDEPLADGGAIATYLAAQKVREFVKVVLVGEGGDETLAGYNWHKLAVSPFDLIPQGVREKFYFYLTTFYKCNSKIPFETFSGLFKKKSNFFDSMASYEINNILPNSLLMKVDKMTMAHSLEARVPFLDHNFVAKVFGFNYKDKISLFATKKLLRKYMQGRLPEEILNRRKHGFILPVDKWLNVELRGFAKDTLLSRQSLAGRIFPKDFLNGLFNKKIGLANIENSSLLWRLLILELWHKVYFKDN